VTLIKLALFMSLYPQMQTEEMASLARIKLDGLSKSLLAAFGLQSMPDFTKIEEYFVYIFQYIFLAACLLSAILGFDLLQREEASGSIEYLYAMPVSRKQIYSYKMIAAIVLYTIFFVLMWGVSFALLRLFKPQYAALSSIFNEKMYFSVLYTYLASLAYMSMGMMLSALLHLQSKSANVGLGVFFVTYVMGIIGSVVERAKILKYFSFYDYANPSNLFYYETEPVKGWILAGAAVMFFLIGMVVYAKRDLHS